MSISLEGLMSPGGDETRALALLKVEHNGLTYDWQAFVPPNTDLTTFIAQSESAIKAQIDAKEASWTALTPKTREVTDPITGETKTVPIEKSEIVRPDIPDYYAKRRAEYPSLGDQLDALWKGGDAQTAMQAQIAAVKAKYPKE
jgi:hypothetical protein